MDTGPILALIDADDRHHLHCRSLLLSLPTPLITTVPCLTEAHYLLRRNLGYSGQETLWKWIESDIVCLHYGDVNEERSIKTLIVAYRDTPMDYADGSLIVAAETLHDPKIFTLDRHFHAYRFRDGTAPQVFP